MHAPPLLEARLIVVTGKGGTGKTTVSASLALAAAQSGRQTLLVEVGRDEQAAHLISPEVAEVGYTGLELEPDLRAMHIEPFEALREYLALQLSGFVANRVVNNRGFQQLMNATPGWRELITLGKIWQLEQMEERGKPKIDLIVVDAPATGHGLTFLDVPRVVASAVRGGPLRRNAAEVEALLNDPKRTRLLPVTLAEELPVRETVQLIERLQNQTGISVDRIVVNAIEPEPLPPELAGLAAALESLEPADGQTDASAAPGGIPASGPSAKTLAACVRHRSARRALHEQHVLALRDATHLPLVPLPFLPTSVRGRSDLLELVPHLLAEPTAEIRSSGAAS